MDLQIDHDIAPEKLTERRKRIDRCPEDGVIANYNDLVEQTKDLPKRTNARTGD